MSTKIQRLLGGNPLIYISIDRLSEFGHLHYEPFLSNVIDDVNDCADDDSMLSRPLFDALETQDTCVTVIIPLEDGSEKTVTLHSQKERGFTKGELLHALAKCLPNQEWGDHHMFVGLRSYGLKYFLGLE